MKHVLGSFCPAVFVSDMKCGSKKPCVFHKEELTMALD